MTGFTSELVSKNLDFKDFVLLCSRAFGSHDRDEPLNSPIPKEIKINTHYDKEILSITKDIKKLKSFTTKDEKIKWAKADINSKIKFIKSQESPQTSIDKLKEILSQAEKWKEPSQEHFALKDFVLEQLRTSLSGAESSLQYYKEEIELYKKLLKSPEKYYNDRLKEKEKSLVYWKHLKQKNQENVNKRNNWVKLLFESLETK